MALSSTATRSSYNGDGATVAFATGFKFLLNSHVKVVLRAADGSETNWALGTNYELTGVGEDAGGTVTVKTTPTDYTPASGTTLVIYRDAPNTQPDELPLGGSLPSSTLERMADRLTMLAQQLAERIGRSLLLPVSSSTSGLTLPEPSADKVLGWNGGGTALENKTPNDQNYLSISSFGETLIDDIDSQTARATLGLVIGADVQAYDTDLAAIAAISQSAGRTIMSNGSAWVGKDGLLRPTGECRLNYSSATAVKLERHDGSWLFINGDFQQIPSVGVSLSNSGLSSTTVYYIYAYMNSGTMTLEASATAYATDSTYGHKIKTGDATRTFVGLARTNGSSQFSDSAAARFVLSYFNRKRRRAQNFFTTDRTSTSTSFSEINSEIRCEFLALTGDLISVQASGRCQLGAQGAIGHAINISGTTRVGFSEDGVAATTRSPVYAYAEEDSLGEGYHYATLDGKVSTNTGTWLGAASGVERCALSVVFSG